MQFYQLSGARSTRKLAEWDHDIMSFLPEGHDCPVDPECPTGRLGRACDLHVTLASDKVEDFVWTWYSECLITDKVVDLFRRAELTGFRLKPVTVTGVKRGSTRNVPRLQELVVTGWGGQVRKESGIVVKERCAGCGRTIYGPVWHWDKAIDPTRWDGSDFFVLWPLVSFIFVSQNVADTVRANELRGACVIPMAQVTATHPSFALDGGCSAGRLEQHYPPEVAKRRQKDILF